MIKSPLSLSFKNMVSIVVCFPPTPFFKKMPQQINSITVFKENRIKGSTGVKCTHF